MFVPSSPGTHASGGSANYGRGLIHPIDQLGRTTASCSDNHRFPTSIRASEQRCGWPCRVTAVYPPWIVAAACRDRQGAVKRSQYHPIATPAPRAAGPIRCAAAAHADASARDTRHAHDTPDCHAHAPTDPPRNPTLLQAKAMATALAAAAAAAAHGGAAGPAAQPSHSAESSTSRGGRPLLAPGSPATGGAHMIQVGRSHRGGKGGSRCCVPALRRCCGGGGAGCHPHWAAAPGCHLGAGWVRCPGARPATARAMQQPAPARRCAPSCLPICSRWWLA